MSLMIDEDDSSLLAQRVDSFRNNLKAEGWLRSGGSKQQDRMRRERVMQDIIRWMDGAPNADVAIAGCSIVLKLSKSEKVLRHTCKLLFKLSLNEDNDSVFPKYHAFESLVDFIRELGGKTPPCTKQFMASLCPLLTHAAGTIKNLTHSDANARAIAELHASKYLARMIATVLNIDMRSLSDDSFLSALQLLTQITEALRNLLTTSSATTLFLQPIFDGKESELVVEILMRTLQPKSGLCDSVDVVSNICRTLSKLSLEPRCLPYLGGPENIHSFLEILLKYQSEKKNPQSLIVRICFILGNLTTSLSADHVYLRAGIADLVSLLSVYLSVELGGESDEDVDQTSDVAVVGARDNEEVLIKLIRLLANIAIDPEAGETLVQMVELEELVQLFACKSIAEHEELVLNIVGAFANFTFYDFEQNCLLGMRLEIAKGMVSLLLNLNAETVVEAGRVLANLSRHADVRRLMAERRGTEVLTVLLDHLDRNVIYQASGCLTNLLLCGSPTTGSGPPDPHAFIILQNDGMKKLINVMYEACQDEDLELAAIAAKALHNLCSSSYRRMMTPDDIDQLQSLVAEILDSGADCVDASDISDNKLELLEVADSLDTALLRMYKDNGTSRGAGADRAAGSPVELEEWDCERGFWFLGLSRGLDASWLKLLFYAEASVQVLLSTSGFLNPRRKQFSYLVHSPPILQALIGMNNTALAVIRLLALLNVPYQPALLLSIPVLWYFTRNAAADKMIQGMVVANTIWAVKARSLGLGLYTVNILLAGLVLKQEYLGELTNLGIWYIMRNELA
ncbi:Armadillo repeat-containing protein 2 [Geranomyces variabilis]|nr:Armadillo repeat-containing protein 2 [Geranomyces variabilis]